MATAFRGACEGPARQSSTVGLRVQAQEYRELDDEGGLVLLEKPGQGKTSGMEVEHIQTRQAHLFHVRNDKVTKQVFYLDCARALADLGARE